MNVIGKVIVEVDPGPHCRNGWGPTTAGAKRSCNYTGGHFCDRPARHKGRCRCVCGSTCTKKRRDRRA